MLTMVKRGRPPNVEPTETISIRLPVSVVDALYKLAITQGVTVSDLARPELLKLIAAVSKES